MNINVSLIPTKETYLLLNEIDSKIHLKRCLVSTSKFKTPEGLEFDLSQNFQKELDYPIEWKKPFSLSYKGNGKGKIILQPEKQGKFYSQLIPQLKKEFVNFLNESYDIDSEFPLCETYIELCKDKFNSSKIQMPQILLIPNTYEGKAQYIINKLKKANLETLTFDRFALTHEKPFRRNINKKAA